jgi:hypothetical protein
MGGISRTTEHRRRKDDPDWPKSVAGRYYVLRECYGYVAKKAAERQSV